MKRKKRLRLIRQMRREHLAALQKHHATVSKMKSALSAGLGGLTIKKKKAKLPGTLLWKEEKPKRLRNYTSPAWAKRSAKARAKCKHKKTRKVDKWWRQCRNCGWCVPRLGREPKLIRLPAILKDRPLPPPLFEDDQYRDMRNMWTVSGVSISSFARISFIFNQWKENPLIERFSLELNFKENGWHCVGIIYETQWYKVLPLLMNANPKKLHKLFYKIQRTIRQKFNEPWLPPIWERKGWHRVWHTPDTYMHWNSDTQVTEYRKGKASEDRKSKA